mmetsp:Transcript_35260/g.64490  ORF Transcript_35260/g.64490 Transcript_35260/m.64490 type:complete len:211 (+) Transcript_35260:98-730(+)
MAEDAETQEEQVPPEAAEPAAGSKGSEEGAPSTSSAAPEVDAATAKARGNDAYRNGQYDKAVEEYSKAIARDAKDHTLFSNRSAAYVSLRKYKEALEDATSCVALKPDWPKGYARKGKAEFELGLLTEAKRSYMKGLEHDPYSEFLIDGKNDVEKVERRRAAAARKSSSGGETSWLSSRSILLAVASVAVAVAATVAMRVMTADADAGQD